MVRRTVLKGERDETKTGPVPGFAHIMVVSVIPNLSFALMLSIEVEYTDIILFTHCFRKHIYVGASILNLLNVFITAIRTIP